MELCFDIIKTFLRRILILLKSIVYVLWDVYITFRNVYDVHAQQNIFLVLQTVFLQ